jgi:mRNA interferase RelE/StbE
VASYRLLIKPSAAKELEALPRKDRERVTTKIRALANVPRPSRCEKLSGHDLCRLRQGDYRVLYSIADHDPCVVVIKIGHRREVYR